MKCPNCGNDMVQSRAGWLCLSCGHIEARQEAALADAKVTLGRDAHAQMAKAAKNNFDDEKAEKAEKADKKDEPPVMPAPLTPPPPDPPDKPVSEPEPVDEPKPLPPTSPADDHSAPAPEDHPTQTPADVVTVPVKPEPEQTPETTTEPESKPEPEPEPEPEPATPPPAEPVPIPVVSRFAPPEPVASPAENKAAYQPSVPPPPPPPPDEDEKSDPPPDPPAPSDAGPSGPVVPPSQPDPEPEQPNPDQGQPVAAPPPPPAPPPPAPSAEPPKPPPAPPATPLNGKPPLQPATHPKHGKFHLFGISAVAIIALAAASAAIFASVIAPRLALAGYLSRLGDAKTMTFSAIVNNANSGYRFALKLNGATNLSQASEPKLAATISGNVSAPNSSQTNPVTGQLTANLVTTGQNLYFKLTSLSLQSQIIGLGPSANWYSLNLAGSLGAKCLAQGNGSGSLLDSSALNAVPIKAASLVGIGKLNGALALHYRGTVDTSKLSSATDQSLSSDCQVAVAALKSTHLTYDIWRSWSQDRLELAVSSTASSVPITLLIDTSAYSRPVAINAPSGAQDAANLFTNVLGASTIAPGVAAAVTSHAAPATPAPATTVAPAPAPAAADAQTRADLAAYFAAYRALTTNGYFPTASPAVTVAASSKSYVVVTSRPTVPGQIWYQAGGVCNGPSHVPGRTATHYLALTTLLADGTPACLDSGN